MGIKGINISVQFTVSALLQAGDYVVSSTEELCRPSRNVHKVKYISLHVMENSIAKTHLMARGQF